MDGLTSLQTSDAASHKRSDLLNEKLEITDGRDGIATKSWTAFDSMLSSTENEGFAKDKYLRGSTLGSGAWGVAYKVLRLSDGKVFAGKASKAIHQLRQEAEVLQSLNHEHILQYVGWHEEEGIPEATLVLTQLCHSQTLQGFMDNALPRMRRTDVLDVTAQLSGALEYLHDRSLFHSDLKPANILIREFMPLDVVLGDCADVKSCDPCVGTFNGTHLYASPEVLKDNHYHGKSDDVWALGMTLLGMLAVRPSIYHMQEENTYPKVCIEHIQKLKEINQGVEIVKLLDRLMAGQAKDRLSAKECVQIVDWLIKTGHGGDDPFDIKAPSDFKAIVFW